jgi:hypothetical protein
MVLLFISISIEYKGVAGIKTKERKIAYLAWKNLGKVSSGPMLQNPPPFQQHWEIIGCHSP